MFLFSAVRRACSDGSQVQLPEMFREQTEPASLLRRPRRWRQQQRQRQQQRLEFLVRLTRVVRELCWLALNQPRWSGPAARLEQERSRLLAFGARNFPRA